MNGFRKHTPRFHSASRWPSDACEALCLAQSDLDYTDYLRHLGFTSPEDMQRLHLIDEAARVAIARIERAWKE